jgi:hypothetical protein
VPSLECVSFVSCRRQGEHTIDSNVLSCAHQNQSKPPSGKVPDTCTTIFASLDHHLLDVRSKPDHTQTTDCLNRENPTLSSAQSGSPDGIDNGRP